jgi:hypothetical protein
MEMEMEIDNKPYFYTWNGYSWCFEPSDNSIDYKKTYPLEKWEISKKSFILARVAYTKKEADELTRFKGENSLTRPNMYYVYDKCTSEKIAVVWKPAVPLIEIEYGIDNSCEKIHRFSPFSKIKTKLVKHLESVYNDKISDCIIYINMDERNQ